MQALQIYILSSAGKLVGVDWMAANTDWMLSDAMGGCIHLCNLLLMPSSPSFC